MSAPYKKHTGTAYLGNGRKPSFAPDVDRRILRHHRDGRTNSDIASQYCVAPQTIARAIVRAEAAEEPTRGA